MSRAKVLVRRTRPEDFPGIRALFELVYPHDEPWEDDHLATHLRVFPEGQHVAVDPESGEIVGMTASLVVRWDDYEVEDSYRDFTDHFWFTNHDREGLTLYAAEVMTHPERRGRGIGRELYRARKELVRRQKLLRIRAAARIPGYSAHAEVLSPAEYVKQVVRGELTDPTLGFMLRQRFRVIGVAHDYWRHDPKSRGHAAIIEWVNHEVARRRDYAARNPDYARPRRPRE